MSQDARGLARQRTTLAWQRLSLDFVVIGALLLRADEESGSRFGLIPAGLALGVAGVLLVAVRLGVRSGHRPMGRRAGYVLGAAVLSVQVCAALAVLPLG